MQIGTATVGFPSIVNFLACLCSNVEWLDVTGTANRVGFSKLSCGPLGFEGDIPYSIALLDYGDYKVFGRIAKDIPDEALSIGMTMITTLDAELTAGAAIQPTQG